MSGSSENTMVKLGVCVCVGGGGGGGRIARQHMDSQFFLAHASIQSCTLEKLYRTMRERLCNNPRCDNPVPANDVIRTQRPDNTTTVPSGDDNTTTAPYGDDNTTIAPSRDDKLLQQHPLVMTILHQHPIWG